MAMQSAPFVLVTNGMNERLISRHRVSTARRAFTMVELALTLTVIAIMAAMMVPKIGRVMQGQRIRRNTAIIAADLEQSFTLAARYRKPMRLSCTIAAGVCTNATYTVADRTGGTVRLSRQLGADADLGTLTLTFVPAQVDIFPSGVSTALLTATITSGISTRTVTLSTAGIVRIP
jgi:prepilin-type N-terminal cleavage/methylation domain-containing protein